MLLRLLKNEFRKKKVMSGVLLFFVLMATMFMASGLSNLVTVLNGTDHYFDLAGIGDYVVFVNGKTAGKKIENLLGQTDQVLGFRTEEIGLYSGDDVRTENGEKLETTSNILLQSVDRCSINLFDQNNRKVSEVKKGHVYLSGSVIEKNSLQTGDVIHISIGDRTVSLIVDGKIKDAVFGSDLMDSTRILMSEKDYRKYFSDESADLMQGLVYYIDTEDSNAVNKVLAEAENMIFNNGRTSLRLCYVLDMIIAFVTLILSVCLVIVSFVLLKFCIGFNIMEDYREIGVMKAIGIGNRRIRYLYLAKYATLALIGAATGFLASIPFGKMLLLSISDNMVLETSNGILFNLLGALAVATAIVGFAYFCTGKIKTAAPLDAIRSSEARERFDHKRAGYLEKSRLKNEAFLAVNDILSSPGRYLSMIIIFCICTLLVLILENTAATMNSDRLIGAFALKSDLYLYDDIDEDGASVISAADDYEKKCMLIEKKLEKAGLPAHVSIELQYKYPLTIEDTKYSLTFQQGLNTEMDMYEVTDGRVPMNKNEVMITPQVSEMIGAKIGDFITIHFSGGDMDCMISGYYESLSQLGKVIRLHNDAPTDREHLSGEMAYQIQFLDHHNGEDLSESVLKQRQEQVRELFGTERVLTAAEYCVDVTASFQTIESVKVLLSGITLAVIFLVTALMERTFISDEKSQIALLKAIGFSNLKVILWHGIRLALTGMIAAVLAAALSVPVTKICVSPIFGMMGVNHVDFLIRPWRIFVGYPVGILLFTLASGMLQALGTGKIRCRDAAGVE